MFNKKYKDMGKKYKLVRFDVEKAKNGAEVVTKAENLKVEILKYDLKDKNYPILAIINYSEDSQGTNTFGIKGNLLLHAENDFDLRILEEVKEGEDNRRRMTNQELAWWLRDCPQEHREVREKHGYTVYQTYEYFECDADKPLKDCILIRSNGGGWREPLVDMDEV